MSSTANAATAFTQQDIPNADYVRYVKQELTAAGFYGGPINNTVDREYTLAVENYQRSVGLPANGSADVVTQMRLVKTLKQGSSTGGSPPPKSQVKVNWVEKLQRTMSQIALPSDSGGFYKGNVTGIYQPRTIQAVMLFQSCAGLPVDGIYGPQTRQALTRALLDGKPLACLGGVVPDSVSRTIAAFTPGDIPGANFVSYIKQELTVSAFYGGAINNKVNRQLTLAIEEFQQEAGLPVTGTIGAVDQMRLAKLLREGNPAGGLPPPKSAVKANWAKKLQQTMAQMPLPASGGAFYGGSKTGVYGDQTIQAVMLFQACVRLPVDGIYGAQTQHALNRALVDGRSVPCVGGRIT